MLFHELRRTILLVRNDKEVKTIVFRGSGSGLLLVGVKMDEAIDP